MRAALCMAATVGSDYLELMPLTKMPASHPSVEYSPLCDNPVSAGDPIPTKLRGPYTANGACKEMSGAKAFYAYGYPEKYTGNPTAARVAGAADLYLIMDKSGGGHFVLTIDDPLTGKGGTLEMRLTITAGLADGETVPIELMDGA